MKPINVLFLAVEAAPLVKVGGLADVAGALPPELRRLGLDVRLVLPMHPALRSYADRAPDWRFTVPSRAGGIPAEAYRVEVEGEPVYLVDGPLLRESDAVYHADSGNDAPKFVFFSLAALELARAQGWRPDVVHTNDWHCAAANCALAGPYQTDPFFAAIPSVITIHNLPYMGHNAGRALELFDLGLDSSLPRYAALPPWARGLLLPPALAAADRIVAVSPAYAAEILTPEFGCGLEAYLQGESARISGILNGLDLARWDPATDKNLFHTYDAAKSGPRKLNKSALQAALHLDPTPDAILAGIVSRLDAQKGIDIALEALESWCARGNQAVLLGSGDPHLERECGAFAGRHPGRATVTVGYDAQLAARIYAGSDVFLMPSRYEPCGLSQMIAMRYGSLPVARAVGGIRDTVRDLAGARGTGFLFEEESHHALAAALWRAEALYREPVRWERARARAMKTAFTWDSSAKAYAALYRAARKAAG